MDNAHLYTVILEVSQTQEVFIDQLRTSTTVPDKVLYAWVEQAVSRGFIKGTDDPQVPFRDPTELNKRLEPLSGVFNVWRVNFLIGRDFYVKDVIRARHDGLLEVIECIYVTADFIKTSTSESSMIVSTEDVLEASDSRSVRQAELKHASYLERFEQLKGVPALSKAITQERRRVEKMLTYWEAKRRFFRQFYNRDANSEEKTLHTIVMYYRGGTYIRQYTDILSNDVKLIILIWSNDVFRDMHESKDIAPQDRLLLMEKTSQDVYTPIPIEGCENVWGTYFSLSEGMVKLTIIKTALDEVVQA